jgi:hypothetical protein
MSSKVALFTLPNGKMSGQAMVDRFRENRLRMARFMRKNPPPFIAVVHPDVIVLLFPQKTSEAGVADAEG